jgi:hypothetical protein
VTGTTLDWSARNVWQRRMDELDAYRCAKLLLDHYGSGAELQAAMRADALEAAGDEAGRLAWLQILAALDELQRTERRPGEQIQ